MKKSNRSKQSAKAHESRWTFVGFLVPVVALWVTPILLFLIVTPLAGTAEKDDVTSDSSARTAVVGSRTQDLRRGVDVNFTMTTGPIVTSASPGVVTSIDVRAGDQIAEGARVASVNGVPVFAIVGGVPLFRDLGEGMHGPDVKTMSELLSTAGFLNDSDVDSVVGPTLIRGIKAFQDAIGETMTGVFRTSYTAYVPDGDNIVKQLNVRIGARVEQGGELLTLQDRPRQIRITSASAQGAAGSGASLADFSEENLRVSVGDKSLVLSSINPAADQMSALYEFLTARAADGGVQASVGNGAEAGETTIKYSGALIALQTPITIGSVAAPAVFSGADGKLCVFVVEDRTATALDATGARAIDGEVGLASVPTGLIGRRVLVDASTAPEATKSQCR